MGPPRRPHSTCWRAHRGKARQHAPDPPGGIVHTRTKSWLTALTAAALLATAVGTAGARNLSISNSNIRADFRPLVFFNGEARFSCNVTIEGSFHYRTIVKSRLALVGYITRVTVDEANCRGAGLLAGA